MTIEWVDVDGCAARLASSGERESEEAVVFVHGNPGSADDWHDLVGACAAAGRRAVAPDLPDFGETVAPAGFEHHFFTYATWLRRLLETLGVTRAHLVLHDFGGPIGLAWAALNPRAVASVTLIDTGLLRGYRWHLMARVWRTPLLGELMQLATTRSAFRRAVAAREPRGLPVRFTDTMYSHYDRRTRRAVLRLYRATDDPGGPAAGAMAQLLAEHDHPALVIWGAEDRYLPARYAAGQREAFPSAEVHVLEGSGHWPYVDQPQRVRELLLTFLARIGAPAPPIS